MALPSLFNRSNPTEPDDTSGPRPPADYPFRTWQDSGPFAVPSELREDYVAARVDPDLIRGFLGGGAWSVPITDGRTPAILVMGDKQVSAREGPREQGPGDFNRWLHRHRLTLARQAAESRAVMAPLEAMRRPSMPCPACGTLVAPAGGLKDKWVVGYGQVRGCGHCVETLAFLVGAEMVARHASLDTLQSHARDLVARKTAPAEIDTGDDEL